MATTWIACICWLAAESTSSPSQLNSTLTHNIPTHKQSPNTCKTYLDCLDLLADRGEHVLSQPVELVEAAPRAAEAQAGKDAAHGRGIKLLIAVEHQDLLRCVRLFMCWGMF